MYRFRRFTALTVGVIPVLMGVSQPAAGRSAAIERDDKKDDVGLVTHSMESSRLAAALLGMTPYEKRLMAGDRIQLAKEKVRKRKRYRGTPDTVRYCRTTYWTKCTVQ
jgi:hypothetical protein